MNKVGAFLGGACFRRGLYFLLLMLVSKSFAQGHPGPAEPSEQQEQMVFNTEILKPFEGLVIHEIRIEGLTRTREQAVRWLLSQHEGDRFSAEIWVKGLHKLYDTTVLYDIATKPQAFGTDQVDLEVTMIDRWTLLPFGILQTGGGSSDFGGGIWEGNFLGYFAQIAGSYSVFDNVASYDLNFYQEFFRDTDFILGADVSSVGTPVDLQADDGHSIGSFTWQRHQEQILFGRKFEPKIRLFSYFEYFQDQIVTRVGAPEVYVYHSGQYRLRPTLVIGRSELTNFLEEGSELTFSPTTANFWDPHIAYSQMVTTYKKVFLEGNTNYALFLNGGAMTKAPIPYLFRLGGYDTVRGFSTNRAVGRYYLDQTAEYRAYLTRFSLPLVGAAIVQGAIFEDGARMWNSYDLSQTRRVNSALTLFSAGAGLRFNFQRFAGAIVRIDFAQTLTPSEGVGLSMGVGQFF